MTMNRKSPYLSLILFTVCLFGLAGLATAIATPIVQQFSDLTAWRVFRRCVSISALVSLILVVRWQGRTIAAEGIAWTGTGKKDLLMGIKIGTASLLLLLLVGLLAQVCYFSLHPDTTKVIRTLLIFIPGALLVGILEELVFRGFLQRTMAQIQPVLAIILTNAIYAAVHLKTSELTPALWRELTGLFLFGLLLSLAVKRTGNLWMAIGLHAMLAYGARVNKLIIAIPDTSWMWFVGTSRLINGVASWVLLGLVALAIVKLTAHRGRQPHAIG